MRHDGRMRKGVVEGEPGIFPDPIARLYRWLVGLFGRRKKRSKHTE